ncbi:unnamed protein product, partial [marine sediment metagenome]
LALERLVQGRVNIELSCLRAMFNKAILWSKAVQNPVRHVKMLSEKNRRLRYLKEDEIERLIANCPDYLRPIVVIALNTGMRKGEILNLKWEDVDLGTRIIYVVNTKTNEKREIPVNTVLYAMLVDLRTKSGAYVFPNDAGEPYVDIRKGFRTAIKKSHIRNFRFHDLRHTFASQLVMKGVDLKTIQELLGHKSIEMTIEVRTPFTEPQTSSSREIMPEYGHYLDTRAQRTSIQEFVV